MENQQITKQELTQEQPKTRKRKLLNDPNSLWAKCRECKEPGNLENMLYLKVPFTNGDGEVLYGCYEGVCFCSEICQEKFKLTKIELFSEHA